MILRCTLHYTNLDVVEGGVNDWLADELLLSDVTVMSPTTTIPSVKVITLSLKMVQIKVLEAMFEAGAGTIGDNYKDCAFPKFWGRTIYTRRMTRILQSGR